MRKIPSFIMLDHCNWGVVFGQTARNVLTTTMEFDMSIGHYEKLSARWWKFSPRTLEE